ncbi:MAG: glycosyl hydrolase family 28 protein [Candidatus Saccharibacteria bacterium]
MRKIVLLLLLALLSIDGYCDKLITYEAPQGAESAPEFEVEVNGQKIFVYNTRPAAFAYFSFEGKVEVKVTFLAPVYNFDIRPKSRNIQAELSHNQLQFSLDKPQNLSIEINKNLKRPLFLFANPLETNVPDKNDKNVIFFEAGKIHYPGQVDIKSNQTVYIEGGAIVRGHFMTDKGRDIKIMGRGILDNSQYLKGSHRPVEINECENVLIDGIILTESRHWSCASHACKNVTYNNLKIVSDNDWDDGIDIVGSQKVLVNNCFIRTKDDCIAVKSGVNYFTKFNSSINVKDVVVQNSVMWNGIWGNGLEIGFETRSDTIQDITFSNCDLIHVEGPEGTFTIHNGDRAVVKNVLYDNIRVEDAKGWLIDFKILFSQYSKDKQRGMIENVRFKNINVEGETFPYSQLLGFDENHRIKGVSIENLVIQGTRVNGPYNGMITTHLSDEIIFK